MGFTIRISRREAERAVRRGVAEIRQVLPERWEEQWDENGDRAPDVFRPAENVLFVKGGEVSIGDWGFPYFWTHCGCCGTLQYTVKGMLQRAKIRYTMG